MSRRAHEEAAVGAEAVAASARAQAQAADPALSVFVAANAGSGKTTTLVSRVARLLLGGAEPGAILCLTYTKAAAAEMQDRLFKRLGGWAVMADADLSRELVGLAGGDGDGASGLEMSDAELSRARRLFARALETPGGLKIQTIHAFCETLLRRFPLEAGVSPRFRVLEDAAAAELSRRARDDLALAAVAAPEGRIGQAYAHFAVALDWERFQALLGLIEAQREALLAYIDAVDAGTAPGPHALCGVAPDLTPEAASDAFFAALDVAAWTAAADGFSTGSANDQKIAARMRQACPVPPGTFQGDVDTLEPLFIDSKGALRDKFGTKSAPSASSAYLAGLRDPWLAARTQVRAARVARETIHALTLARVHAAYYEAAKAETGALDFTDLVSRTADLLTRRSTAAWVLYKLDGGVDHVLIDEAQDTAPDQWAIVRALTGEFFAGEMRGRTVFAVGDEKQSIYSFQGARPEQLRQQARLYEALVRGAGGVFVEAPLETSYRSTPEVLAFVDAVFDDPARRRAVAGPEGDIARHLAARAGQHGTVDLVPLFQDPAAAERDAFDPVDAESEVSGRKQLARRLAEDIRRQVEAGVAVHDRDGRLRPCGYGDFLVLVRRRDATFEEVIRALKLAGAPVAGADRLKLSEHILFKDLTALTRTALFPDDDLSLAEVLRGPLCDVADFDGDDSLFALAGARRRTGSLWRELAARAHEQPAWARARELVLTMIAARDGDPFGFFSTALNRVDDTGRSGRGRILARLGREAEEAIDETLNQVLAAEGRGASDLESCLALLESAEVQVKRELEGPRGEVRVMTVHGAKGLEAPIVILPDTTLRARAQGPTLMALALAEGTAGGGEAWLMAPGSSRLDIDRTAEARAQREARVADETMRLLYVALTRARDRIVVMGRRSASRGPDAESWWSVITDTFDRLEAQGAVRVLEDGVRRYGVDPTLLETRAGSDGGVGQASLPDWAGAEPTPDAAARFTQPSRLEGRRDPAPSPLARTHGLGRFRRGDLIHRLLERLPDLAPEARRDAAVRLLAREPNLDAARRDEMIAAAFGVLDDPLFAPVFGPGSRAEVALVGGADALPPGVFVSGRIDRLVVTPGRVLAVDYKTNRPAPHRIEDADPAYVRQMAAYVAVLRRLYPDRGVEAALVWTDGPRLMAVPDALMDVALRAAR